MLTGILDPLYTGIAYYIVAIHKVTKYAGGASSGLSWALAIVLLTATVRLLLFPLFVKQIRSQRKMTVLQPMIKELQVKHKGDRETLNVEMMKLYKEHGANPIAGCLPLILQMPIFISLFHVLRSFQPRLKDGVYGFHEFHGITEKTVEQAGKAKVFGAPIAAGFNSSADLLKALGAEIGPVRIVTMTLIILMGITTFITQKQLMAKNAPTDSAAATQQKVLLYVMPVMMAVFGINVALGVLIYWTTTNFWSMAQQRIVIKAMDSKAAEPAPIRPPVSQPPPPGFKPGRPAKPSQNGAATDGAGSDGAGSEAGAGAADVAGLDKLPTEPAKPPASGANRNNRKKGQRRGGRR